MSLRGRERGRVSNFYKFWIPKEVGGRCFQKFVLEQNRYVFQRN